MGASRFPDYYKAATDMRLAVAIDIEQLRAA